jgi:hypothetical protein
MKQLKGDFYNSSGSSSAFAARRVAIDDPAPGIRSHWRSCVTDIVFETAVSHKFS